MLWLQAIGNGILLGLGLAFAIGPVFFGLIDTSINKGLKDGTRMALGISASDVGYTALAWLGIGSIFGSLDGNRYLAIGGGIALIAFGLAGALRKPTMRNRRKKDSVAGAAQGWRQRYASLIKGFVLNTLNPSTPVIWITAATIGQRFADEGGRPVQIGFLASILATTLATDLSKVYLARRLSVWLTPRTLLWVNRAAGAIMIVAGVLLMLGLGHRKKTTEVKRDRAWGRPVG